MDTTHASSTGWPRRRHGSRGGIRRGLMSLLACGLLMGVWAMPCRAADGAAGDRPFELVRDGRPVATIVVPDDPLQVVQSAAEELQLHVRLITGAALPMVAASREPQGNLILLGAEAAGRAGVTFGSEPNAWVIRRQKDRLYLAGDDSRGPVMMTQTINNYVRRGTLFAVYDLLEKHLGVRWLWPGELGTVTPKAASLSLPDCDAQGKPAFLFSRFRDSTVCDHFEKPGAWSSVQSAHRFFREQARWLIRHRFSMPCTMNASHAFTGWWETYGQEHPEYFNLLPDGTRRSDPTYCDGKPQYVSLCVSNPAVHRQIVENWLAVRSPWQPYIDAAENDTCGKCVCERCLSWDVPDPDLGFPWAERVERARKAFAAADPEWWKNLGSLSDRYARFYQAVLDEARRHDPAAKVLGLAYANFVKAPREAKVSPEVVFFVTVPQYYPFTEATRLANRQDWIRWAGAGASQMLRPNYMLEGGSMPLFLARRRGEDLKFFADNGMIGSDFDSLTGQFGAMGPTLYMTARLNDNPALSVETVLDEYLAAFGPATEAVRAYVGTLESVADNPPDPPLKGGGWFTYGVFGYQQFTPEVMAAAQDRLDAAAAQAAGDALAGRRVAYLAKGLRHAALCAAMQKAAAEHKAGTGDIEEVRAALLRLVAFRRETEPDLIANIGHLYDWETRHWNIPRVLQGIPKEAVAEAMAAGGAGGLGGTAAVAEAAAESSDCGATFTILLKEDATIDRLRFFNRAPAGGCRGFRVAVSADGRSFTTVLSADLRQAERPDEAQEFAVPPAAGRYLKLEILSGYEKKTWGLGEFEAYEGTRNVAALAAGAELVRWSSDYGSYDFFAYTPKHLLDGVPSTVWLSSPVPVPCE